MKSIRPPTNHTLKSKSKKTMATKSLFWIKLFSFSLLLLFFFNLLTGQESLNEEQLKEQITEIEKEIEEEQKFFMEFQKQQNQAIKEKEIEKQAITSEISKKINDIKEVNQKIFTIETQIQEIDSFNQTIKNYFLSFAKTFKQEILQGIPFEKEKRAAIVSTLINDLENDIITINEAFIRINNLLDSEVALGYDSQNIRTIEKINGSNREFELLRIGRVFFALIDNDEIILWEKNENREYQINTQKELSVSQLTTIKNTLAMLQGRKAPEIVSVPFAINSIIKKNN